MFFFFPPTSGPVYISNISSGTLGVHRVCTHKTSHHCYSASETCRGPRANQNVFKCMTCVKLMKIHDFFLTGLLELKSSEKGECKEFYLMFLILESFSSLPMVLCLNCSV